MSLYTAVSDMDYTEAGRAYETCPHGIRYEVDDEPSSFCDLCAKIELDRMQEELDAEAESSPRTIWDEADDAYDRMRDEE